MIKITKNIKKLVRKRSKEEPIRLLWLISNMT